MLISVISLGAKSDRDAQVVVAVFDAGFEGIDQLSADRVLRKEQTVRDPVRDEVCALDRRYNGTGAYEKTWGWNYLGCGARRSNSFINNRNHGFRMAREILEGTSRAAVLPITSVVDAAGQHILFRPPDSFLAPMQMASDRGAKIVNMSFALSPPFEPEPDDSTGRPEEEAHTAHYQNLPKFEATEQALFQMVKDHPDTVFVVASGNATRQYEKGRWIYRRNNLKDRLPQALKVKYGAQLPNLFVVSLCDESGEPMGQVNFMMGAVDVCVYRPTPSTVNVEKTTLAMNHLWSSDAAASFTNVLTRIFENGSVSSERLRDELDTYPGIRRDPQGRYDIFVDHRAFSVDLDI